MALFGDPGLCNLFGGLAPTEDADSSLIRQDSEGNGLARSVQVVLPLSGLVVGGVSLVVSGTGHSPMPRHHNHRRDTLGPPLTAADGQGEMRTAPPSKWGSIREKRLLPRSIAGDSTPRLSAFQGRDRVR